jgi:plastocyanin
VVVTAGGLPETRSGVHPARWMGRGAHQNGGWGLLAAAAASLVVAAGCAGSVNGSASEPEPGDVEVKLVVVRFEPANVEVPVGKRVVWRWTDRVQHNVVADGAAFAPSKILNGGAYVIRFDKAGTYPYQCTLHDGMRGTVVAR